MPTTSLLHPQGPRPRRVDVDDLQEIDASLVALHRQVEVESQAGTTSVSIVEETIPGMTAIVSRR